jgi:hypothetical protein
MRGKFDLAAAAERPGRRPKLGSALYGLEEHVLATVETRATR